MIPAVHVVVCMDTEGPCADPGNAELLATWDAVDAAMDKLFDPSFRARYADPQGVGMRFGWFFLTWTGFRTNPRERAFGYHVVRDHYAERWGEALAAHGDEHCWHYHQPAESGAGNEWGLDWDASFEHDAILSRQALERDWFPTCFRAGGTILDPVSSRWVDAWFPFDYSNRAPVALPGLVDWSSGVAEWGLYHPSQEDFRVPGTGRRRMARCLDLVTWAHRLTEQDVEDAFARVRGGRPAILACFEHDYRDIEPRLEELHALVTSVARRYEDVPWRYAAPVDAARAYLDVPAPPRLELEAAHHEGAVHVRASAPLFQSVPWLAVRRADGEVVHVEADVVRVDPLRWRWTPPPGLDWAEVAVAGSTDLGAADVVRIEPRHGPGRRFLERRVEPSPLQPRSVWEHSKYYAELSVARASGEAGEMDAVEQAVEIVVPRVAPGATLLDVGSAAGHLHRSVAPLGLVYHGIDPSARAIEIGRQYGPAAGLPASHLRPLAVEELPPDETYDVVVSLSTLAYLPMYHLPLEAMARAARSLLVVRSCFGDRTEVRYLPDALLEPGFQAMRTYLTIYGRDEVAAFLESEGFAVTWVADRRQAERFGGEPEVVGGLPIPYEFLVAERVAPPPSEEAVLGPELAAVAREWRASRGAA